MNLSADDVAVAIISACRETGGEPLACASRGEGGTPERTPATNRARHYALHALVHVFPDASKVGLCSLVGCVGQPKSFWSTSWHQVVKPRPNGRGHAASWWNEGAYARVIHAIQAALARRRGMPPPDYRPPPGTVEKVLADSAPHPKLGMLDRGGYRPPPDAIAKILDGDDSPVFDRGGTFGGSKPREYARSSKADLARELREAAANTARMPTRE
jgi:hypothetical protein